MYAKVVMHHMHHVLYTKVVMRHMHQVLYAKVVMHHMYHVLPLEIDRPVMKIEVSMSNFWNFARFDPF